MKLGYKVIALSRSSLIFSIFFFALNAFGSDVMVHASKKENYIAEKAGKNTIKVERLQVSNLIDYGISLHAASNFQEDFKPEFVTRKIQQDFFDHWNKKKKGGWRLFCDCKGEYFQKDDRNYFRVYEAKFFLVSNETSIETVKNPEYMNPSN